MSRTVFVLKVYVIVKKQKKKNIRPHPHMDPNKMPGVYGGTAEYQKNYYIYKNQIKNIKIKNHQYKSCLSASYTQQAAS